MFDKTSRYSRVPDVTMKTPEGMQITYKARRMLPQGDTMRTITNVTLKGEERLDLVAARTLGSPEAFWRICDANDAMNPFDLADQPGQVLRIPMPQHQ